MSSKGSTASIPPARNKFRYRVCFHDAATNKTRSVTLSREADARAFFLRLGAIATIDFAELTRMEGPRVVEILADHFSEPQGGVA